MLPPLKNGNAHRTGTRIQVISSLPKDYTDDVNPQDEDDYALALECDSEIDVWDFEIEQEIAEIEDWQPSRSILRETPLSKWVHRRREAHP